MPSVLVLREQLAWELLAWECFLLLVLEQAPAALWVGGIPAASRTARFHPLAFFLPQILQRLTVLASESLRALEEQLMDPLKTQDVKVFPWAASTKGFSLAKCTGLR